MQDPIPQKARWIGFVVGIAVVLGGLALVFMGGNTMVNKPGYFLEGGFTALIGVITVFLGGYLAGSSWQVFSPPRPPGG